MKKTLLTTLFICSSILAIAQFTPTLSASIDSPNLVCQPGQCTELHANFYQSKATTTYTVASKQFAPSFPTTGGIPIDSNADDVWSPVFNLPFNFCFYGNYYNQLIIGSNGVISFDLAGQSTIFCPWSFNQTIPNTNFPIKNAIYGVYQDVDIRSIASGGGISNPSYQNANYYILDTGINVAPNRVFVANFNELPQYQCGISGGLQTSQIVLYEGTNIIDVIVYNRTPCNGWQNGAGVIGIQDLAGTSASTPTGRNTGNWSATNEYWRFTPNGNDVPVNFSWYKNNVLIAGSENVNPLSICPTDTDSAVYAVRVNYENCNATIPIEGFYDGPLLYEMPDFGNPDVLSVCGQNEPPYTIDLTSNAALVLAGLNPLDYSVKYYDNYLDASYDSTNNFVNPTNYVFDTDQTIYMSIMDLVSTGCVYVKSFDLTINSVAPPTGAAQQNFAPGETLADLEITGNDIVWYDAATGGNVLPSNTALQHGMTYYASQTLDGCQSRNVNSSRLAVTVSLVLANSNFGGKSFAVHPNPVNSLLTISAVENIKSVEIFNAVGQRTGFYSGNATEINIDMASTAAGVYFVKIDTANETQTTKIVKQ